MIIHLLWEYRLNRVICTSTVVSLSHFSQRLDPQEISHFRSGIFLQCCCLPIPHLSAISTCLFSKWCFVISIHIIQIPSYIFMGSSEIGEKCEGGQGRLSTPTSLVMEIIQCNIWIAIFMQQMRAREAVGGKGAARVLIGSRPHLPTEFSTKISCSQLKLSKQYVRVWVHIITERCQETEPGARHPQASHSQRSGT